MECLPCILVRDSNTIVNGRRIAAAFLLASSVLFFVRQILLVQILILLSFNGPPPPPRISSPSATSSPAFWHDLLVWVASYLLLALLQMAFLFLYQVAARAFVRGVYGGFLYRKLTLESSLIRVPEALYALLVTTLGLSVVLLLFFLGVTFITFLSILLLKVPFLSILVLKAVKFDSTILLVPIFYVELGGLLHLSAILILTYMTGTPKEKWGWEAMRASADLIHRHGWRSLVFLVCLAVPTYFATRFPGYTIH